MYSPVAGFGTVTWDPSEDCMASGAAPSRLVGLHKVFDGAVEAVAVHHAETAAVAAHFDQDHRPAAAVAVDRQRFVAFPVVTEVVAEVVAAADADAADAAVAGAMDADGTDADAGADAVAAAAEDHNCSYTDVGAGAADATTATANLTWA